MFTVLRSSAGAGKTHALVKHYLTLCLRTENPASYRQVLALTFTNKAAAEMRERVLSYLEQLAERRLDKASLRDVMGHLMRETGIGEDGVALRAQAAMRHMLHHWSDVAISTIDAFTRRVARPFARELQLDQDLRMTTEQDWYLDRAVQALIAEAGVDEHVTLLLTEACMQLLHEERAWEPAKPLRELSAELAKESAAEPLARIEALDAAALPGLMSRLRSACTAYESALERIGREGLRLLSEEGIGIEDAAHGKGGYAGWFRKLAEGSDGWLAAGPNALKPLSTGVWHAGKASAQARDRLAAIAPRLEALLKESLHRIEDGQRANTIRRAVLRELPAAFALRELDRCLEALKHADGVAFFSDLTRRVDQVVRDEPVPYIYERLGERYRHFLLDEFQDTSLLQWSTLLPLIDNALGTGGSALLVGDAKQAIYRWRNGEVRLFANLPELFGKGTSAAESEREAALKRNFKAGAALQDNHRSASTIVRFNNALFGELALVLPERLRAIYDGHEQRPFKSQEGLVDLRLLPKEARGDAALEAQLAFVDESIELALVDGFKPGDIAILVRSGRSGEQVSRHLVAHGHAVISPDGLRLSGDPAIEMLIDLLRVIHSGAADAAARVLQYRSILLGTATAVDPFPAEPLADPLRLVKDWLRSMGDPSLRTTLSGLLKQLAGGIGLHPAHDAQLLTLLDEAHAFAEEAGQDIGGFLEHWQRTGGRRSAAPPDHGSAIQVMTIHKAKGLQFPVVIVPQARMAATGNHAPRLWMDPGDVIPELPAALVRKSSALREAGAAAVIEEEDLSRLDDLDLLYVAFTRPEQRLHALVPQSGNDPITDALAKHVAKHGEDGRLLIGQRTGPWNVKPPIASSPLRAPAAGAPGRAPALRMEAPDDWSPGDPDPYRSHGNAVHAVLSRVRHAGMLRDELQRALRTGELSPLELDELMRRLVPLIESERLAPWFGDGLTVRTEAAIITADGHALRPDRIVFEGASARVLDIKTGVPRPGHLEQVRSYMRLLRALGHEHVEGALLYAAEGELTPVEP